MVSRAVGFRFFKCYTIIRFVFALAFWRFIPNCSTANIREDRTKRILKVKNDGAFLLNLDSFKHKTWFLGAVGIRFLFINPHEIRLCTSFPTPYSKLFYCKNSRRYDENNMKKAYFKGALKGHLGHWKNFWPHLWHPGTQWRVWN